jgi:hypothetical protein
MAEMLVQNQSSHFHFVANPIHPFPFMPIHPKALQASALGQKGEYELARQLGCEALNEQDTHTRLQADISKKVVAFSLFGSEPVYGEGAILNASAIKALLPTWTMHVYHDDSISNHVIERLQRAGAKTIHANEAKIAHWPGTFWRFHAVSDPHVKKVLFRDADSVIGLRELSLIDEWLASSQPFHVIRDWYTHVELILAGLWGAHAPYLAHMPNLIDHYVRHELEHSRCDDQLFLAKYIWPRICQHTLIHDSVHRVLGAKDVAYPRGSDDIGTTIGGYGAVSYPATMSPAKPTQRYHIRITEVQSGELICSYTRTATNGQDQFRIPFDYEAKIKSGVWKIESMMAE